MKRYEFLEHPADIKIRAFGRDLGKVFVNSALGMMGFLYGENISRGAPTLSRGASAEYVKIKSHDLESLLVDWLSEILYLSDANNRAYVKFNIKKIDEKSLEAEIGSCPAKAREDIKAVTYNDLKIGKQGDLWVAEVVYDI